MAIALTVGRWYLIESDSAANQDWITNNSGDPDLIDLTTFTEGLEFITVKIPRRFAVRGKTGAIVTPSGAGESYDKRKEARFYNILVQGILSTRTQYGLIDKFLMTSRHTSGTPGVFKRYYLIFYFGVNDHILFTDANSVQQSYCKGIVSDWEVVWVDARNQISVVRMNFWSVWEK